MRDKQRQSAGWPFTVVVSFALALIGAIPVILWGITWPIFVVMFIGILLANWDLFLSRKE